MNDSEVLHCRPWAAKPCCTMPWVTEHGSDRLPHERRLRAENDNPEMVDRDDDIPF